MMNFSASYVRDRLLNDPSDKFTQTVSSIQNSVQFNAGLNLKVTYYVFKRDGDDKDFIKKVSDYLRSCGFRIGYKESEGGTHLIFIISL